MMGPYCKFCDNRCFVYLPEETPEHIVRAYGTATLVATCLGGQRFEKEKTGYCYSDIVEAKRAAMDGLQSEGVRQDGRRSITSAGSG
jgi:hypothetical protein